MLIILPNWMFVILSHCRLRATFIYPVPDIKHTLSRMSPFHSENEQHQIQIPIFPNKSKHNYNNL